MSAENQTPSLPETRPLPCPWCGVSNVRISRISKNVYQAMCSNMDCTFEGFVAQALGSSEADVIERWNRRPSSGSAPEPDVQKRLEEIRGRLEKATPGPWFVKWQGDGYEKELEVWVEGPEHFGYGGDDMNYIVRPSPGISTGDNAELIANAPTDLRFLLDELSRRAVPGKDSARPEVICFSGSTRFLDRMAVEMWEAEKRGAITLGCHLLPASYTTVGHHLAEELGIAGVLDEVHLRKIDLADRLVVINVGGYVGESTRREIAYAESKGKPVSYIEDADRSTPSEQESK